MTAAFADSPSWPVPDDCQLPRTGRTDKPGARLINSAISLSDNGAGNGNACSLTIQSILPRRK
jgi:hypothetical protein